MKILKKSTPGDFVSNWTQHPLGHYQETKDYFAFFGNKNSNFENLKLAFPQFAFCRIKQIHSDILVESSLQNTDTSTDGAHSAPLQTADAHYTQKPQHALLIATADCMPLLMYHPAGRCVLAIHAGWRGVANRITPKSLSTLRDKNFEANAWKVFIGPHILFQSFEVENSVRDQLLLSAPALGRLQDQAIQQFSPQKALVNLELILRSQLSEFSVSESQIEELKIDTLSEGSHHSYRRDKEQSGRNLSFIVLKS